MKYYSGLDVSLKTTFISIIDETGEIVRESEIATDLMAIKNYLEQGEEAYAEIGIESGQLSIPLCKGLLTLGLPVICVDARHMAAALSARINKNDRNDARGIAQMMRAKLYKKVQVKTDEACEHKVLLGSRNQLVTSQQRIKSTLRGLLKIWNIRIETNRNQGFMIKVTEKIKALDTVSQTAFTALLDSLAGIEKALAELDKLMVKIGKEDETVKLLMSVPGVGVITALTYKATLDDAQRFKQSETVGAYLGLTPRQYASGELNRQGSISKMGPINCRSVLYEAAFSLLVRCKRTCPLKSWGLKLAKRKGLKKAVVAVARKLAVIMHRMLIDKKEFRYA